MVGGHGAAMGVSMLTVLACIFVLLIWLLIVSPRSSPASSPLAYSGFMGYGVHRFDSLIGIFCALRQESVGKILRFPEAFTM